METIFVLQKNYQVEREKIAEIMNTMIDLKGIKNTNIMVFKSALKIYCSLKFDIVDCLIAAYSVSNEVNVFSFDKDIDKAIKMLQESN